MLKSEIFSKKVYINLHYNKIICKFNKMSKEKIKNEPDYKTK